MYYPFILKYEFRRESCNNSAVLCALWDKISLIGVSYIERNSIKTNKRINLFSNESVSPFKNVVYEFREYPIWRETQNEDRTEWI